MNQITINTPDDWHVHLRDGDMLLETVPTTARQFNRAIVMPNLVPPITRVQHAIDYRNRIKAMIPSESDFTPLMTLYLNDETSIQDIEQCVEHNIPAVKLYPAGATTNSELAVNSIERLYPIFECMQKHGIILLIHGEVTSLDIDIFDREKEFIDQHLILLHEKFPELKIVFEHITTSDAVSFVLNSSDTVAATITPQHLLMNRNDLLVGGIRPHNYCLPILKRNSHQQALREVVASGSSKFFLGSDSAPHTKNTKESDCGCAGCYSAVGTIELYAEVFEQLDIMDKLEGFASHYGPDFYGLKRNNSTITLIKQEWTMPEVIQLKENQQLVPFYAGQKLQWKLSSSSKS